MNKPLLVGAMLMVGLAIAVPMVASPAVAQTAEGQSTQSVPDQQDTRGRPGMMGGMGMGDGMGMQQMMPGVMGGGRGIGPMSRMHHMMMRGSPRERCEERLAQRAAMIAYTTTKLNLTPEQKPLWDKLNSIVQAATDRERQLCSTVPSADQRGQETILDRVNRREQFLSARLQALQQAKPALEALYQSLSPDQKAIINHPFRR
jgi:LTXXQ motif family protein